MVSSSECNNIFGFSESENYQIRVFISFLELKDKQWTSLTLFLASQRTTTIAIIPKAERRLPPNLTKNSTKTTRLRISKNIMNLSWTEKDYANMNKTQANTKN